MDHRSTHYRERGSTHDDIQAVRSLSQKRARVGGEVSAGMGMPEGLAPRSARAQEGGKRGGSSFSGRASSYGNHRIKKERDSSGGAYIVDAA